MICYYITYYIILFDVWLASFQWSFGIISDRSKFVVPTANRQPPTANRQPPASQSNIMGPDIFSFEQKIAIDKAINLLL